MPNKQKTILIVDDNRDLADTLAKLIEYEGHSVFVAYDAQTGFQRAQESSPDIIFHDITMPGVNGYTAAGWLRSDEQLKSTYLVAITAHDTASDRKNSMSAGFDLHLAKPVDFEQIKEILDSRERRH